MDAAINLDMLPPAERARRVFVRNRVFFRRLMFGRLALCLAIGFCGEEYWVEYGNDFQSIERALIRRGFAAAEIEECFFFAYR